MRSTYLIYVLFILSSPRFPFPSPLTFGSAAPPCWWDVFSFSSPRNGSFFEPCENCKAANEP